ncbi:hypothetical protein ACGFMK_28640 [Amycolatopsis sp. NPDC049252]|uniref:hypothetical protein n=1 Tax=Amycolatopsis sp. NPDC049252 TaxID=3363933 RepID=UPI00371E17ED
MDEMSCRRLAADLAEAAKSDDHERVADVVAMLSRPEARAVSAAVVSELAALCAGAVAGRCPPEGPEAAYGVLVENDRAVPVEVDALPPGLRAVLRALLAALNDDRRSQDVQAGLATRGDPEDVRLVLVQCLVWLAELDDAPGTTLPRLSCLAG